MQDLLQWKEENQEKPEHVYWDALKVEREREHRFKNRKVHATLTSAPCTSSCWHAEEYLCRCSCGGKNHGIGHAPTE